MDGWRRFVSSGTASYLTYGGLFVFVCVCVVGLSTLGTLGCQLLSLLSE